VEKEERVIISLPGVPREMEYLVEHAVLPYLRQRFDLHGIIKTRVIHTAGVGESTIDDLIGELEAMSNPSVGLAAHSGQVDVRITAKANSVDEVEALILPIEDTVRQRLGKWVYGADQDTLEGAALDNLERHGWRLAVVEAGLGGNLIRRLASIPGPFAGGEIMTELPLPDDLPNICSKYRQNRSAEVGLAVAIYPAGDRQDVHLALVSPLGSELFKRPYGGPPEYAPRWALHHSLDIIRNLGV
jgi:hypothetical protein